MSIIEKYDSPLKGAAFLLKLESKTLKDLYRLSIIKKEIEKLRNDSRNIEKDMFQTLFELTSSINDIIIKNKMVTLKEIIDKHNFSQLIADSKVALDSSDRDYIESVEKRVISFEWDVMKLSQLYGVYDYRNIEELENIEEKLKITYEHDIKNPLPALLIVLMWNSRVLHNSLSSRAVWLSYKKP